MRTVPLLATMLVLAACSRNPEPDAMGRADDAMSDSTMSDSTMMSDSAAMSDSMMKDKMGEGMMDHDTTMGDSALVGQEGT